MSSMRLTCAPTHTTMTTHIQFARDQFSRDYNRADLMTFSTNQEQDILLREWPLGGNQSRITT